LVFSRRSLCVAKSLLQEAFLCNPVPHRAAIDFPTIGR
jgi:hypothetical protein